MNSINNLNALSIRFDNPWLLFLIIPAVAIMLWPYFRIPRQHRNTRNRVISLALHSVILCLAVLMLAGISFHYTRVNVKKDVILLVDRSDSAAESEEDMDRFIQTLLSDVAPDYRIGVVTFANGSIYSTKMSADTDGIYKLYSQAAELPSGDATDISSALLYCRELLSSPQDGRIILLSDGEQTDGSALATVKSLAEAGIRVDTVYFPSKGYAGEVQITSVDIPGKISVGDTAQITVVVESTNAQSAVLSLYDNGEQAERQNVNLSGGQDVFSFEYKVLTSKLHVLSLDIEAERDTLAQNNSYYAYINIEASTKALLVDGSGSESDSLLPLLEENFEVTKVGVGQLPSSVEELCKYDEVIFMNVANADLPVGFDDILTEYVQVYGGGLYTVGGDKAYMQEDMAGSKYQELLPVEANTDAKSLGLLLVIDSSGSMAEKATGSSATRIELAIDAAVASVNSLSPEDYVGVVSFNATATSLAEMTSVARKDAVIRQIRSIETATGTYYYDALEKARNMLTTFSATELKHIIFITDGEPVDTDKSNFMNLIDRMARNDITLSTIALGPSVPIDIAEEMAERGGGRFYNVAKESELTRIMVEETTTAAGHYYNNIVFTPSIVSHTAAVAGISELPQLGGFYGTRLKDGATMVLGYEGSPIYAEWTCGLGRVGSFMSDLNGAWSAEYFTDEAGIRFIVNTVNQLFSKTLNGGSGDVKVDFEKDNFTVRAVVTADVGGSEIIAQVEMPDEKTVRLKLEQLSENTFVCTFRTEIPGVYTLRLIKFGEGTEENYLAYTAFSYSKEYRSFADDACFQFMESLSENGNGNMLFSAENLFGRENETVESDYNPALPFLIVCAVLFLLDIAARKFKIKWPSEIKEEKKNKQAGKAI